MADVKISFNCGCGYRTELSEAAVKHCDEQCHIMTVSGLLKPSVAKTAKTRLNTGRTFTARTSARVAPKLPEEPPLDLEATIAGEAEFNKLRDRLKRRV